MTNSTSSDFFGSDPYNAKWQVVRGDTCEFSVEFYKDDGKTLEDISTWTFSSTAYDNKSSTSYPLTVTKNSANIIVTAPATVTKLWGTTFKTVVSELSFDVQVVIDSKTWTPIIGTITVLGDVTRNDI